MIKERKKCGDMTMFGLILSLVLLIIFSPIFSYVYSRQSITESTNLINASLKSYSESTFNELFDEAKSMSQTNYIYSSLVNNDEFASSFPDKVLRKAGFKFQSNEDGDSGYYISDSGIVIANPIISMSKDNDAYHFKLMYDSETPLSILGLNFYTYKNTYIAVCDIQRNGFNYADDPKNSASSDYYKSNYIYKVALGEENANDIIGYMTLKDDSTKVLYIVGNGRIVSNKQFTVEMFDGTSVSTDAFPWRREVSYTVPQTSEYKTISMVDEVYFIGNITNIPDDCFYRTNISKIDMGEHVQTIGSGAFCGCSALSGNELIIPKSVTTIGDIAFSTCNLTSVILQDGLKQIGDGAFMNNNLTKIYLPSSINKIGQYAFEFNSNLTDVISPNYVKNLREILGTDDIFSDTSVEYIQCADGNLMISAEV